VDDDLRIRILAPQRLSSPIQTNAYHTAASLVKHHHAKVDWIEPPRSPFSPAAKRDGAETSIGDIKPGVPWRNPLPGARRSRIARAAAIAYARRRIRTLDRAAFTLAYTPLAVRQVPPGDFVVYHVVDAPNAWSDAPPDMGQFERALRRADLVLAASQPIHDMIQEISDQSVLFENCYNGEVFAFATLPYVPQVASYVGAVNAKKIDAELLSRVAAMHPGVNFELWGPVDADFARTLQHLCETTKNVSYQGQIGHTEANEVIARSALSVLPGPSGYSVDHSLPLKLVEAAAVGRPAVTTGPVPLWMKATARHARTASEFSQAILELTEVSPEKLRSVAAVVRDRYTYEARNSRLLDAVAMRRDGYGDSSRHLS
jgi:glycosyltransferase involved in cell wall biosynthesis